MKAVSLAAQCSSGSAGSATSQVRNGCSPRSLIASPTAAGAPAPGSHARPTRSPTLWAPGLGGLALGVLRTLAGRPSGGARQVPRSMLVSAPSEAGTDRLGVLESSSNPVLYCALRITLA
jgi:hypothetical protein